MILQFVTNKQIIDRLQNKFCLVVEHTVFIKHTLNEPNGLKLMAHFIDKNIEAFCYSHL